MLGLFSKKKESLWVYEARQDGHVIGTFPTSAMAERKLKEKGGGTIRPRKTTAEEAETVRKISRKLKWKPKEPEAPGMAVLARNVSGSTIKKESEFCTSIGGEVPITQNPVFVIDSAHISGYTVDNPFALNLLPKELRSRENITYVADSAALKRAAKGIDTKSSYTVSLGSFLLVFDNGKYPITVDVTEATMRNAPDIDFETYAWITPSSLKRSLTEIKKISDYAVFVLDKDTFVHVFAEDDGKRLCDCALGLANGSGLRYLESRYPVAELLRVCNLFKECSDVKISFDTDFPLRFDGERGGRKVMAIVAPRINST